ncbi:MAG: hypothetical protein N2745_03075 [Syntrophorhabdaceae bacterium]|nr:hypothetical protein [Syntrophorhabdaceae bacterium]
MKRMFPMILMSVVIGMATMLLPTSGPAFDSISLGEEREITVWGFLRNSTGFFTQNPNPWGPTADQSGNRLAIERTWLRANVDLKLSNQFRFYGVGQFAYEPWLPVEQGSISQKNGYEYTDKNINDVMREAYFEWKPNKKHNIKFGKMNVVWGETITGRVGDVVNPADIRWVTPFSLEDTNDWRIPQFMVRGIHDLDSLSSSFEWIISPTLTSPEWSVSQASMAANLYLGQAGQRFAMAPETRFMPPRSIGNTGLAAFGGSYTPYGNPEVVAVSPMNGTWYQPGIGIPGNGWTPSHNNFEPLSPFQNPGFVPGPGFHVYSEIPDVKVKYPRNFESTRGGFRTSTTIAGYTFGIIYYHRQVFEPVTRREGIIRSVTFPGPGAGTGVPNPAAPSAITLNTRRYTIEYPDIDNIGIYMNKQLPWPGVIRTEVMYTPNMPYNYFIPLGSDESGVVRRDNIKYLFAYDLSNFFYFDWHKTAPFDITFEHVGEWIPNARELQYTGPGVYYATKLPSWQGNFNMQIRTNWFYNKLETSLTGGYGTFGNSWLLVPRIKWTPGWLNKKFSADLRYVYVDADNRYEGLGVWKDKNYILLQTQFNF